MRQFRKMLSLLLVLVMLLGLLPLQILAAESDVLIADDTLEEQAVEEVLFPVEEETDGQIPEVFNQTSTYDPPKSYHVPTNAVLEPFKAPRASFVTETAAINALVDAMWQNRSASVTVYFYKEFEWGFTDASAEELWQEMLDAAIAKTEPYSNGGDYLANSILVAAGAYSYDSDSDFLYFGFQYEFSYFTDREQEGAINNVVYDFLQTFDHKNMTDYEKVCYLYDYLTKKATLDPGTSAMDLDPFTAYGALVNGRANCHGFAMALYRLLRSVDINARIITGTQTECANVTEHSWNLIPLAGKYYNADAGRDAALVAAGKEYKYFLQPNSAMTGYKRNSEYNTSKFNTDHPMGQSWFPTSTIDKGSCGGLRWSLSADGVLTFTGSGYLNNYKSAYQYGWYDYRLMVKSIVLPDGLMNIPDQAFSGMFYADTITTPLPDSIETIGRYAFDNCYRLETITLPESLETISEYAFNNCESLKELVIPDSVEELPIWFVHGCEGLERLVIPQHLTKLPDYFINGCSSLKEIDLPDGITELPATAFSGCTSLTQLELPDGITTIGRQAFYNCWSLQQLQIPETVTTIEEGAFQYCTALEHITLPDSALNLGKDLFKGSTALKSVELPAGLTTIPQSMFEECTALEVFEVPEGVATVDVQAFYKSGLRRIVFPASVEAIGNNAISNCANLEEIVFLGDAPQMSYFSISGTETFAFYPANNPTWTQEYRNEYSNSVKWVAYKDSADASVVKVTYANMTLGNSLAMNFAFRQDHRKNWEGCYVRVTKHYSDFRDDLVVDIPYEQWGSAAINGEPYFTVKFDGIAAKEMTDTVRVDFYDGEGQRIGEQWTDRVADYALRTLSNPSTSEETKVMIVDMLYYGSMAQQTFGYANNRYAFDVLYSNQKELATPSAEAEDRRVAGENYLGTQLRLESQIMLRMAFSNVTADMTAHVSFTDHYGRAQSYTIDGSDFEITGATAVVMIDQIVLADARNDVTVQIMDGDGNVVASATDSVASYIARMRQEVEDPLYEAILKFSDSAYAYFH